MVPHRVREKRFRIFQKSILAPNLLNFHVKYPNYLVGMKTDQQNQLGDRTIHNSKSWRKKSVGFSMIFVKCNQLKSWQYRSICVHSLYTTHSYNLYTQSLYEEFTWNTSSSPMFPEVMNLLIIEKGDRQQMINSTYSNCWRLNIGVCLLLALLRFSLGTLSFAVHFCK